MSFTILGNELHPCTIVSGFRGRLGEKLVDHASLLLELVALALEGVLHVGDSPDVLSGLELGEIFETMGNFGKVAAALLVLFAAVVEV